MFCTEGLVCACWRTGDQEASGVRRARAISNMVVPNLSVLFSSPSCNGSNPIEQYFRRAIFLGPVHPFLYTISFCPHRVSQGKPTDAGQALVTACCPTRRFSSRREGR